MSYVSPVLYMDSERVLHQDMRERRREAGVRKREDPTTNGRNSHADEEIPGKFKKQQKQPPTEGQRFHVYEKDPSNRCSRSIQKNEHHERQTEKEEESEMEDLSH